MRKQERMREKDERKESKRERTEEGASECKERTHEGIKTEKGKKWKREDRRRTQEKK